MRIAVLGAGVAGLVAALRLTEAGHTVDVYERWPGLGGQAATLDVGGRATCSSATTTTCSPPTATSPRSTTSWGCRTSSSGISSSVAYFAAGQASGRS